MSEDWDNVVILRKKKISGKERKNEKNENIALVQGRGITTKVKDVKNTNTLQTVDFRKLDDNTDAGKHKKVELTVGRAIMKGRNAKKLSQKDLAQRINEKPNVINNYEQSKAIPNHQILMKMQKVLGIKLVGKNIGDSLH